MRAERQLLAGFGQYKLLGSEVAGGSNDFSYWFDRLTPWHQPLLAGPPTSEQAVRELNDVAIEYGGWAAIGAWKVLLEFSSSTDTAVRTGASALAACVKAYDGFGITNLALHIPLCEATAFEDVLGRRPPMDGFFGPPVFTTNEGPQKSHYLDAAAEAAAARHPVRLKNVPGVAPQGLERLDMQPLFDFGRLLLVGPLLVAPEARYEPALLAHHKRVADGADHAQVLSGLRQSAEALVGPYDGPRWASVGAARFVEEYLEPSLTGSADHVALLDPGLDFLVTTGVLDGNCSPECLSGAERQRLRDRGLPH